MKLYISLVGELASIRIQNYAGLLASKLSYSHKNWLIVQYHGLLLTHTQIEGFPQSPLLDFPHKDWVDPRLRRQNCDDRFPRYPLFLDFFWG